MKTELLVAGLPMMVHYKYSPARAGTATDPPEPEGIEIKGIFCNDDIQGLLGTDQIDEIVEQLLEGHEEDDDYEDYEKDYGDDHVA